FPLEVGEELASFLGRETGDGNSLDGDVVAVGNHVLIYKDFRDPAAESLADDVIGESSMIEALPANTATEGATDDDEFIIDLPEPGDVDLDDLEVKDSQS
ncbi:MAG: hypothetical protein AAFR09_10930, partial [Pseudomonadota bacterium]